MNIQLPGKAATFQANQRERAEKQRTALGVEARSWYRITNQAGDEAEVMLYDEVGGWFGATADEFIADLRGITAPNLRVRINSPGGSVFEGIAIANALRSHPANVTVQVDGIAASIASVIAMSGDRIEMAPNTMLMIHDASGVCMGNADDMQEMAELLDLISDNIADAYAARAGGTRAEWRDRMRAETWYLPEDAVDAGLADEAAQTPKAGTPAGEPDGDEAEMARAYDLAAYGYTGPRREQPKAETGLTEDIRSLIGEEVAAQLRATVATAETVPAAEEPACVENEPAATTEYRGEHGPESVPLDAAPADDWTALVAALIPDDTDDWSALVSHLTEPDTSSSAAAEA
ncbi:head maturation protease, ClpP-related [Streptomyces sp. F-1]|uniref:head maturation protease, ClpP-related n=1 Tax=Streptomyces sp. F-1 TaxID=463642 RepID=UPI00085CAA98|nr:head maturation protease, ClpP-related [Streptomyces sp. F-1]SFY52053.1 ATP-dependent Clp protease proteolytic subunit [Streptomyces sp. F-1]